MKFANVVVNSNEYWEFRKKCVTSTDAAIINGTNSFKGNSPYKLWQLKLGLIEEDNELNYKMEEGNFLEDSALNWFNKKFNTTFYKPSQPVINEEFNWIIASLDAYNEKKDYILEIKCGEKTYDKAAKGYISPYYFDQIQHQLLASGKFECRYVAFRPDKEPIVISVKRDQSYIASLLEKEKEFYEYLEKMIPPPYLIKEFIELREDAIIEKANKWKRAKENLKMCIEHEKLTRQELLEETDDGNCIIPDAKVKIERINKQGLIDYKKLCKDYEIKDEILEKYRKPQISFSYPVIIKKDLY